MVLFWVLTALLAFLENIEEDFRMFASSFLIYRTGTVDSSNPYFQATEAQLFPAFNMSNKLTFLVIVSTFIFFFGWVDAPEDSERLGGMMKGLTHINLRIQKSHREALH